MPVDIIKKFNWVDIFVLILLFRICYSALKGGLAIDFFKLLGTIAAVYLSLHYYIRLSDFLRERIFTAKIPLNFLDFSCLLFLSIFGILIFVLLRVIFSRFIKMEAIPDLNKWGGFALGIMRGFLFVSLIIFMFVASDIHYLRKSVRNSYSGGYMLRIAPATYSLLWEGLISKFATGEKFNKAPLQVQEGLN